ncbi:MAG: hypothetical protein JWP65_1404 [Ramlibacter sp.]|jgi:hypothetical protein|nr:hypothetical protein [Ramlibacter sp.]
MNNRSSTWKLLAQLTASVVLVCAVLFLTAAAAFP